jgi:hypothetical protein
MPEPPVDPHDRALLVEWLAPGPLVATELRDGRQPILRSWARARCSFEVNRDGTTIVVRLASSDGLRKTIRVSAEGTLVVEYLWDPALAPPDGAFVSELSLGHSAQVSSTPAASVVVYPIETVAKSERGFDRTRQGECLTCSWPAGLGQAALRIDPRLP